MWHDAEWKLVAWAMLNASFMVAEALFARLYRIFEPRQRPELSRWLRAAAGASYVYVLFFVNLTGYALGLKGTTQLVRHVFLEDWAPGLQTLLCTAVFLFAAVQACGHHRYTPT